MKKEVVTEVANLLLASKEYTVTEYDKEKKLTSNQTSEREKLMTNVREVLKWSNATLIRCLGRIGYACCYCEEQYPEPALLKKHIFESHLNDDPASFIKTLHMTRIHVKVDITELHCKICSKNIDKLDKLMQHLHEDHDKKLFMNIKNYMVPFKFDSDSLRCSICINKFTSFKMLLEHMNVHCRNFVCEICDAGFITRIGLTIHSKSHVTGSFSCKFCEKVYSTVQKKKYHEKYVHSGTKLNKCGYCGESFKGYHQKQKHLQDVHAIAPITIKCHACDRTFTCQKTYRNHTRRDHLMERRFKCTQCHMEFYSKRELSNHMIKHTGLKQFQCELCQKVYGRKKTLSEHVKIHMGDRRFKCEHCGMAFVQRCSWRGHMRAKHGERV